MFFLRRMSRHPATIFWLAGWGARSSRSNHFTNQHPAITLPSAHGVARLHEPLPTVDHTGLPLSSSHFRRLLFFSAFMKTCPVLGFRPHLSTLNFMDDNNRLAPPCRGPRKERDQSSNFFLLTTCNHPVPTIPSPILKSAHHGVLVLFGCHPLA